MLIVIPTRKPIKKSSKARKAKSVGVPAIIIATTEVIAAPTPKYENTVETEIPGNRQTNEAKKPPARKSSKDGSIVPSIGEMLNKVRNATKVAKNSTNSRQVLCDSSL